MLLCVRALKCFLIVITWYKYLKAKYVDLRDKNVNIMQHNSDGIYMYATYLMLTGYLFMLTCDINKSNIDSFFSILT